MYERLCLGGGPTAEVTAAGGCLCCLRSPDGPAKVFLGETTMEEALRVAVKGESRR